MVPAMRAKIPQNKTETHLFVKKPKDLRSISHSDNIKTVHVHFLHGHTQLQERSGRSQRRDCAIGERRERPTPRQPIVMCIAPLPVRLVTERLHRTGASENI